MAEKRIFLIFVDSDLNLCKALQVGALSPLCTDLYENLVKYYVMNISLKFHKDLSFR